MITLLEDLPNELLIDLFEYIPIRDLFYGFWQLNSRLNSIIQSMNNLSLVIDKNDSKLISLFTRQIVRLVVATIYYENIDLSQFKNLHSLTLHRANDNHLEQIRPELLPDLVYLSISLASSSSSAAIQLAGNVFSNRFSSLRYADLGQIHYPFPMHLFSLSVNLRFVSIRSSESALIRMILLTCPNLQHFQFHILDHHVHPIVAPLKSLQHPLKQFFLFGLFYKLSLEIIDILLIDMPNLQRIFLQFWCTDLVLDLAQILCRRLKYLRQFGCHIIGSCNNDEVDNFDTIRRIHPCFNRLQCTTQSNGCRLFTADLGNK